MPKIAAYFGISNACFLIEKKEGVYSSFVFPYVYSYQAFSSYCTEGEFNENLIKHIIKLNRLKVSETEVYMTGFMNIPEINYEVKGSLSINDLLKEINDFEPIFLNNFSVISKDISLSYIPAKTYEEGTSLDKPLKLEKEEEQSKTKESKKPLKHKQVEMDEEDYYANLAIYPQLVPTDPSSQLDLDRNLIEKFHKDVSSFQLTQNKPVLFTGERFSQQGAISGYEYALMLDFINTQGYYNIYVDKASTLILLTLLKHFNQKFEFNINDYKDTIRPLGTLINLASDTECLIKTDVETTQFFDVVKNTVQVLPFPVNNKAKLSLKNHEIGNVLISPMGGDLGLVFDTRLKKDPISFDFKLLNNLLNQFDKHSGEK